MEKVIAGAGGFIIARELNGRVICFMDDAPSPKDMTRRRAGNT